MHIPLDHFTPHTVCPNCLEEITFHLPVQPLYTLEVVCELIPASKPAVTRLLGKLMWKRRYKDMGSGGKKRLFSVQEIKYLRSRLLHFTDEDDRPRRPDENAL